VRFIEHDETTQWPRSLRLDVPDKAPEQKLSNGLFDRRLKAADLQNPDMLALFNKVGPVERPTCRAKRIEYK
jgi:hypothetical protein